MLEEEVVQVHSEHERDVDDDQPVAPRAVEQHNFLLLVLYPMIALQIVENDDRISSKHSKQVGPEQVEQSVIPPALNEVGHDVFKTQLAILEEYGECPGHPKITQHEHLTEPAEQVRDGVDIVESFLEIGKVALTLRSVKAAVLPVDPFSEWDT